MSITSATFSGQMLFGGQLFEVQHVPADPDADVSAAEREWIRAGEERGRSLCAEGFTAKLRFYPPRLGDMGQNATERVIYIDEADLPTEDSDQIEFIAEQAAVRASLRIIRGQTDLRRIGPVDDEPRPPLVVREEEAADEAAIELMPVSVKKVLDLVPEEDLGEILMVCHARVDDIEGDELRVTLVNSDGETAEALIDAKIYGVSFEIGDRFILVTHRESVNGNSTVSNLIVTDH